MNIPSWLPTALIFCGALFVALGGLLEKQVSAKKSKELTEKTDEIRRLTTQVAINDTKTSARLDDLLARSGNDKNLKELIEARSRLLQTNQQAGENLIDDILAQAESKATDYRKMEKSKSDAVATRTHNYLLTWEPLFRFVTSEFDRLLTQLKNRGVPVDISKTPVPFAQSPTNSSYLPMTARYGDFRIDLQLNNAGVDVARFDEAYYFVRLIKVSSNTVELEPLTLRIGEASATCNGKDFAAPKDGMPPKELTDLIQINIVAAIERMLIASEITRP